MKNVYPVEERHGLRNDIQGLRGVAISLVVLFHAGLPGIPGGFVGVDVFFVISGFLITGLLLKDIDRYGRINFLDFFARRARRLVPAALLLLIVVMTISVWLYPPDEQREWQSAARAAALYMSNLWLAGRSLDYFESSAHANPLLHTWSLAVEEQFYLVWPLLLWLMTRRASKGAEDLRSSLLIKVALISLASLVACLWLTDRAQPWAFFGMPLRAWEFGLGALVALRGLSPKEGHIASAATWGGLAAIVAAATLIQEGQAFPGYMAALPAGGTALLLLGLGSSARNNGVVRMLSSWPFVKIGNISYSWYLWHWPFFVWAEVLWPIRSGGLVAATICVSIVPAALSLHLVENPIRRANFDGWSSRLVVLVALGSSLLVAGVAWLLIQLPVPANQAAEQARFSKAAADMKRLYSQGCLANMLETEVRSCSFGSVDSKQLVVLFGDSHAAHLMPALMVLAKRHDWRLVTLTKSACPALDISMYNDKLRRGYRECDAWRLRALAQIAELKPQMVVLASSSIYPVEAKVRAEGLSRMLDKLRQMSLHQVVIRDSPWPGFNVPGCLGRATWLGRDAARACTFGRDANEVWYPTAAEADRVATTAIASAQYHDLSNAFCATPTCEVQRDSMIIFSDSNHLTFDFSEALAPQLARALTGSLGPNHPLLAISGS